MTAKHTPGPWIMARRDGVPHGDSDNLGWDWDMGDHEPPSPMRGIVSLEADARLIAAAPEMLDALAGLVRGFPPFSRDHHPVMADALDAARAAIAKATGDAR